MKIAITGGHLTPALALIEQLKKNKRLEVIFFGRKHATEGSTNLSAEFQTIKRLKIKFIEIQAGRLQRKFTKHTIPSLLLIPVGFFQAMAFLAKERPKLVVSFGGYLSFPIVIAASLLGIETIVHEQASILGLANKISSTFANKIYLSWEDTKIGLKSKEKKTEVIGNLIRESLYADPNKNYITKFVNNSDNLLLVTGGNQGSHFINKTIFEILPYLSGYQIVHLVGTANHKNDLGTAESIRKSNYLAISYLDSVDFGYVLKNAHLVIARSGANTVWELAIFSKPAILIPLPIAANNEQLHNAQILEKAGSAIIANQKYLTDDKLIKFIKEIEKSYQKYLTNALAFSQTLPKDAASIIALYISKYQNK